MKIKIACRSGDLRCEMPVAEAQMVFDRFTGRSTEIPQAVVDRMGVGVDAVPGLRGGTRLNYLVARERPNNTPQLVKDFLELSPEDTIILMPPQVGG